MKTALVTGASRGIGLAIAEHLLTAGWAVHGTYNSGVDEAKQLKSKWPDLTMHQVDFTDRNNTYRLVEDLLNSGTTWDAIVNNAGVFEMETFGEFDIDIWDRVFEVNLNAPLLLVTKLQTKFAPDASVVNISSLDGLVGSFASMAYSASKAALINLTKSLANNLGRRGVRVNTLAPGWIDTGMSTDESMEAVNITPLGRNGKPAEVAAAVAFFLGEGASFINGSTTVIDGGFANVDYIMLQEAKQLG